MKRNKKILDDILFIGSDIGLFVFSIVTKNYKVLIISLILTLLLIIIYLYSFFSSVKEKRNLKLLKEKFDYLKEKDNKTILERCYVSVFQEKMNSIIQEELKKQKIKEINSLDSEIVDVDQIGIYYQYKEFDVIIFIKNNCLNYYIDTPVEYDVVKNNDEFEKEKNVNYNLSEYELFSDFISSFCILMKTINDDIDNFSEFNPIDKIFNGRLYEKIDSFNAFLKFEGLICGIFGLPVAVLMFSGIMLVFNYTSYNNILGYIVFFILGPSFGVYSFLAFIRGINDLIKRKKCIKDIKLRRTEKITAKPTKIKIYDERERYENYSVIRYIIIYFKDIKLIIPLMNTYLKKKKSPKNFIVSA